MFGNKNGELAVLMLEISNGNRTEWSIIQGANLASDFKSAKRQVEITSTITLELYDTKFSYQLIGSKC